MDSEENSKKSVEKVRKFLENDSDIEQAILFGSFATRTNREQSDMDLAITYEIARDHLHDF